MNGQAVEPLLEHLAHTAQTHVGLFFAPNDHTPPLEFKPADGATGANRKLIAVGYWIINRDAKAFLALGTSTSDVSRHAQFIKLWS